MKRTYGFGDMYRSTLDKLLFCKAWTVAEIQRCVDAISAIMGGVEVFYYDKCLEQTHSLSTAQHDSTTRCAPQKVVTQKDIGHLAAVGSMFVRPCV